MKWSSKPQHSVWASTLFMGTVVPHSLLVVHNNDDFDQKLHFWIHHSIRPVATNFQSSSSLICLPFSKWFLDTHPSTATICLVLCQVFAVFPVSEGHDLQIPFVCSFVKLFKDTLLTKSGYAEFSANNSLETIFLVWKYLFVCQTVLSHHPSVHPLCSS